MPASSRIRTLGWIAALLFAALPSISQTSLRDQLKSGGIPEDSFSEVELDEIVDSVTAHKDRSVYFVYVRIKGNLLIGNPYVLRYDQKTGGILRSELKMDNPDECCGSPLNIRFVDDYIFVFFHVTPSAATVLALDKKLKIAGLFGGIDFRRIARNQIVVTENTIHFAPVHPESLLFIDLPNAASLEIYPSTNDVLRDGFVKNYPKQAPEVCNRTSELCDDGEFDEGCTYLGGDGQGRFALQCGRSASYRNNEEEDSVKYASDDAIYIFSHSPREWTYCEQAISEDEATTLDKLQGQAYDMVKSRCIPNKPVVPDMSTAGYSPFPKPKRRTK